MARPPESPPLEAPAPDSSPSGFPVGLLEQLPEAIAALSREARFRYVNGAAERFFGSARGELLGREAWEALPGDDGPMVRQALERAAASGQSEHFEHFSESRRQWLDVRVHTGADTLWLVITDLTGHKQAARLRVLAEASRALSAAKLELEEVLDTVVRQVVAHLSDSCGVALVSADGQWLDTVAYDDVRPADKAAFQAASARSRLRIGESVIGKVALSGQPMRLLRISGEQLAKTLRPEHREMVLRSEHYSILAVPLLLRGAVIGTLHCVRRSPRPAFDDDDEALLRELADRSALAIANARLHQETLMQARVLDSMAEGVSVSDEHGLIVYTNPAEDRMFGYGPGELQGQHVTVQNDYPSEENARVVEQVITELKATGVWSGEWRNVRKDGTPFVTRAHITALELWGRPHWVCVQQDVSEQKRAEAERAALLAAEQEARTRAERTAEYARRLQQVTQLLGQALSRDEVAGAVLEVGVDALGAVNAGIWQLDAATGLLELMQSRGYAPQTVKGFGSFSVDAPVPLAEAVRQAAPLWMRSWAEYAERVPASEERAYAVRHRHGMANACLPLLVEGRAIGGLTFGFEGEHPFEDVERWFLQILTQHAAQALERAKLFEAQLVTQGRLEAMVAERQRAEERMRFLAEASALLASSLDYERTLAAMARVAVPVLADWCAVDVLEDDGHVRRVVVAHEDPERARLALDFHRRHPPDLSAPGGLGKVLRTGEPELMEAIPEALLVATVPDPERLAAVRALGLRSYLSVPLRRRGRVVAALTLGYAESDRRYTGDDLRLVEELALRAATAMDNAMLYQEAREAVAARDTFLGVASHELNTPLTSLKLNLQGLRRALVPGPGVDAKFQSADRQLTRLSSLIRELLDVSRITAGRLKLEPEPLDLAELVREVAARVAEDAARAGCELRLRVPSTVPGLWDRLRVDQVLQNLLSNALKYGHDGPVDVELEAGADSVTLRVRDEGIGIAPEDQPRLFQKFLRVASERHYSGFGLGLWIVRQVVDAMEGRIHVDSDVGRGATFTVVLPRRMPPSARPDV
ncbi:GAF domain-containing protein [Pyxidicoccus xibeiensis]|uniref:GAF domain-containing protein n=1 Tax=Pyxidicoccus xibeiensis TaxID=2906759 RepID=UPI0020A77C95|nr:GAF domain-containing protein [Pyxidicoccus xibeiensis]MCP3140057.1 GAF domain-containing protein [Pyxidicoccus xibeiensis]